MKKNRLVFLIVLISVLSAIGIASVASKKSITKNAPAAEAAKEKSPEEVCLEHKCTMNNCTMTVRTDVKPGERIICPVCGEVISTADGKVIEAKARKILYYRNPMNPEVTSPVPAKDSMGMDYVPVYEEPAALSGGPTVMINPEKQQLIGVKTEPVNKMDLVKTVRASGKIAYDPDLMVAQEEFIQALNNEDDTKESPLQDVVDRAKALTFASRNRLKLLGMSEEQISRLEKTKKSDTSLYLPGEGQDVWAYISIYEYEIGLIKIDAPVEIEAVAYPGEVFQGVVKSINPVLDPATRTNQIRVQVTNPESKLKPEMFVNAGIKVDLGEKLAVPEDAVLDTGLRKIVFLSKEGGIFESREIKIGQKANKYYEVLNGLSEGDVVVTSGNFLIDSESRLKSVAQ